MDHRWPLVGRDRELASITDALRDGEATGVVLAGPGGVGKTRLAREASAIAQRAGFSTASVLATRAASDVPLGALAPFVPPGDGDAASLFHRARAAVLNGAREAPLFLMVDDAHLLDGASAALLLDIARDPRVFVVATQRTGEPVPDPVTALWKDAGAVRIDVPPLSRHDVEALLLELFQAPLATTALEGLWERCRGNPLALGELLRAAMESGALVEESGVWHLVGHPPISSRLIELLEDRLGALAQNEREALAIAGLAEPLRLAVYVELVGMEAVRSLEGRGVISLQPDPGGEFVRPAHPLYGEVAVASVGELRRRALLGAVADAESAHGLATPADVVRVASWRLAAGGPADPDLLVRAARIAYASTDYDRTAELAAAAWKHDRSVDAGHLLGFALGRAGRHEDAEAVLSEASLEATDDRAVALVAMARAENLFRGMGDVEAAMTVTRDAQDVVRDHAWRAELTASAAMFVLQSGRAREALALVEPLLAPEAPPRVFVKAAYVAGPALANAGRADEALALAVRALPVHQAVWAEDLFQTEPEVHHVTALMAHVEAGNLVEAEAYAELALRTAVERGVSYGVGFMAMLRAMVALRRGAVMTSAVHFREAISAFAAAGYPGPRRWALAGAALAASIGGDAAEGAALLAEADELATLTPVRFNEGVIDDARGWVLVAAGHPERARQCFSQGADRAIAAGEAAIGALLLHSLARTGGADAARDRLVALTDTLQGRLAPLRRDHVEALAGDQAGRLESVAKEFEALGANLYAAEAAAEAARAHRRSGGLRRATAAARLARDLAHRCEGAATPALMGLTEAAALTKREHEVALLAARGLKSKEIADRLCVSRRTVDNHLQRAFRKLGISCREELGAALGTEG